MVILLVGVRLKPEKRREFLLSARSLAALEGELFQAVEDENRLLLVGRWASEREAEAYAASDAYRALRGALNTLCEQSELEWVRGVSGSEALTARHGGTNRKA
jgi:quinol monooxygenase YgiN